MKRGGGHKELLKELLTVEGFWKRLNQFSLKRIALAIPTIIQKWDPQLAAKIVDLRVTGGGSGGYNVVQNSQITE